MFLDHDVVSSDSLKRKFFVYLFVRPSAPSAGQQALMPIIYVYRDIKKQINTFQQQTLKIINYNSRSTENKMNLFWHFYNLVI